MCSVWHELNALSNKLEQRIMEEVGMTKRSEPEDCLIRFNVGGSLVNIRASALDGSRHLGSVFQCAWDERVPIRTQLAALFWTSLSGVRDIRHPGPRQCIEPSSGDCRASTGCWSP